MKQILIPMREYEKELNDAKEKGYNKGYDAALHFLTCIFVEIAKDRQTDFEMLRKENPRILLFEGTITRIINLIKGQEHDSVLNEKE
jgi:hypothetical protein